MLDTDSLIDWMLLEGYCNNMDLEYGNVAYCMSEENGGQWKLVMYDMDATFRSPQLLYLNLLAPEYPDPSQTSLLILSLLKNSDFRERVLLRASELYSGPLRDEELIARMDGYAALLAPEMPRAFEKLGRSGASWEYAVNELKNMVLSASWHDTCIDRLCQYLKVSPEERALYFGD